MTTAQCLDETRHASPLRRRARRLGAGDPDALIRLAVKRGCIHYAGAGPSLADVNESAITNEELVALLLLGENPFEPTAIRCAAQLASKTDPIRLGRIASRERAARVLDYIASEGERHDSDGADFWRTLRRSLGPQKPVRSGVLPHWSRFVSDPGTIRGKRMPAVWLKAK